ncbi:hypothetical protein [Flavobacterium sp. 7A]|uniref:hypothetical protein n=1 Tax=Flavobacterium sp. 7A TaxID=2940571 RepID=UPI002226D74C|nr:hypothetical protein [Flavobacterium sp. 7A]MCW2119508.1 putative cupredoxin-like copper-binding protein [Flavobacterium sp. 7A]
MSHEELLANFPNLEKGICYKILEEATYYLEEVKESTVTFKTETDYWNLCIENNLLKTILLLENEFSIMKNETSKKCDWVLYEDKKIFFVESKDVKPRSRNKERKDAVKQLIATIEYYNSKIDLSTFTISSQICFKSNSRTIKTGDQARKVLFKKYNSDFNESNFISFE